ncbi:MAG TPA: DUF4230 domain-containing protein [Saprospiraceae bacterium]|nr:DUF4230 domain-containing protein [Saprospiraceae bacterium]
MSRIFLFILCILLAFGCGVLCGKMWFTEKIKKETTATVMLEKIRNVMKIGLVEMQMSELINTKDYYYFDISPLRKSAIARVQGTVTAGINMDSASVTMYEKERKVVMTYPSTPEILSVDHDIDYYDLQQGTFNTFKPEELTNFNQQAKQIIIQKSVQAQLLTKAEVRQNEMLSQLKLLAEQTGWELVLNPVKRSQNVFKQ